MPEPHAAFSGSQLILTFDKTMKRIFALALSIFVVLVSSYGSPLDLHKSQTIIRDAILKITPLGITISQATISIKNLKTKTFHTFDQCPNLPRPINRYLNADWPLGTCPKGKAIICLLGEIDKFPPFIGLTYTSVGAWWGFDRNGILIDVFVEKHAAGL